MPIHGRARAERAALGRRDGGRTSSREGPRGRRSMRARCGGCGAMMSANEASHLELEVRPDRDRGIVTARGEVDLASAGALQEALDALLSVGWESVVVDLQAVTFIDSIGLSLLLNADRSWRQGGAKFAIVDGSPAVASLLELTGLDGHFRRARAR